MSKHRHIFSLGGSATIGNVPVIKWTAVFGVFISRFFYFAIFVDGRYNEFAYLQVALVKHNLHIVST
jgi:hypothetical protein